MAVIGVIVVLPQPLCVLLPEVVCGCALVTAIADGFGIVVMPALLLGVVAVVLGLGVVLGLHMSGWRIVLGLGITMLLGIVPVLVIGLFMVGLPAVFTVVGIGILILILGRRGIRGNNRQA
ncbi:MAG: hypothetical protein ACRD4O_03110 [Bryobacteraceae bacterium]